METLLLETVSENNVACKNIPETLLPAKGNDDTPQHHAISSFVIKYCSLVVELAAKCVPLQANSSEGERLLQAYYSCTSDRATIVANAVAISSMVHVFLFLYSLGFML